MFDDWRHVTSDRWHVAGDSRRRGDTHRWRRSAPLPRTPTAASPARPRSTSASSPAARTTAVVLTRRHTTGFIHLKLRYGIKGFSRLFHGRIQGYFSDKKHNNHRTTAPPSGLVRSLRDRGRMMQYLHVATFTLAILLRLRYLRKSAFKNRFLLDGCSD